ncbi:uncharacterized protein LOC121422277 isoform X1 [Lytechinus variegatus]|uniref:uncharacterized protein LOC121414178 isoform X1 n=1 Tax=Lytechinus variegatus TaxID=7654 RepID=UPI001BB1512A|nr:uncharacterized protein LOC121414178 isoform X1 [Lytechinus variegatus]XP_041473132.1 uncharacterized protein LOC121422277 isoform X1 [Lytechinus variegatus]
MIRHHEVSTFSSFTIQQTRCTPALPKKGQERGQAQEQEIKVVQGYTGKMLQPVNFQCLLQQSLLMVYHTPMYQSCYMSVTMGRIGRKSKIFSSEINANRWENMAMLALNPGDSSNLQRNRIVQQNLLSRKFLNIQISRYRRNNLKASSKSRKFSTDIPDYLHNRPLSVIKFCMDQLESSKQVRKADVRTGDAPNSYKVQSISRQTAFYNVSFDKPACDCFTWRRNGIPCKHFFAVFTHTNSKWQDLPESYRSSPFLIIDVPDDIIPKMGTCHDFISCSINMVLQYFSMNREESLAREP